MSTNLDELEAQALRLDPQSRARLAARLLHSLDDLSDDENERLWAEEALRRDEEIEAGLVTTRPADEVFRDARSRLK